MTDAGTAVRVALVGLGAIGRGAHLPALLAEPRVDLVAAVDPDPAARDRVARLAPGVAVHADLAPVLTDPTVTAVVLATPPWVTAALAPGLLRGGRYVLAEKPVAVSVAAATAAYDGLPATDLDRLQVGLTYRHDPALRALRTAIAGGTLGPPPLLVRAHVYDERRDAADPEHLARITATLDHGPPVVHEGAHVLDWLAFLLGGAPAAVADAWAVRTAAESAVPNLVGARLAWPDGTAALTEFGWLTDALPRCEVSVLGDRGLAVLDGRTFALTITTAAGTEALTFPGERGERCFRTQLARFADLVTGTVPAPDPSYADGLAALRWSEEIARRAVPVPAPTPAGAR